MLKSVLGVLAGFGIFKSVPGELTGFLLENWQNAENAVFVKQNFILIKRKYGGSKLRTTCTD